jgi:hypothetical protein
MQLAAVQKAVRAGCNFKGMEIGDALDEDADVFGAGLMMATKPTCPSGGVITYGAAVPAIGTPYGNCAFVLGGTTHVLGATDTSDW